MAQVPNERNASTFLVLECFLDDLLFAVANEQRVEVYCRIQANACLKLLTGGSVPLW